MVWKHWLTWMAVAAAGTAGIVPARAQAPAIPPVFQETELRGEGAFRFGEFGNSVAISGDTALVGAPLEGPGAAYVYERDGGDWVRTARLVSGEPESDGYFGFAVALAGDTAVVGAPREGPHVSSGAVYVFTRNGGAWSLQARLTPEVPEVLGVFGYAVAVSGNTLAAGAPSTYFGATSPGAAEVFIRRQGRWRRQARLTAPDGVADDLFGSAVALSGDTALFGARRHDGDGIPDGIPDAGAAYVFVRNAGAWSFQARLMAAHPRPFDRLGFSVALDGDTAVAGAWLADRRGPLRSYVLDTGAVYVFVRRGTSWSQQARLYAPDAEADDHLGYAVTVAGDRLAAGAWLEDAAGNASGSVYLFRREGEAWTPETKLTASDTRAQDRFGNAVALGGHGATGLFDLVVGAFRASDRDFRSGAAYVFEGAEPE